MGPGIVFTETHGLVALYNPGSDHIEVSLGLIITDPVEGMISLLHEYGHAQAQREKHAPSLVPTYVATAREVLEREAFAWRWAVRQIRKLRPLMVRERDVIRRCFRSYLAAAENGRYPAIKA